MFEKKVIDVKAPGHHCYGGHISSTQWQAGYTILFDTPNVKYISIDFLDGIEIVVSKIVHPFGIRYYVSVPWKRAATSMLVSLTDTSSTTFKLLHEHSFSFVCEKSTEYHHCCHHDIRLLQIEDALTIAEVLRDLGDF